MFFPDLELKTGATFSLSRKFRYLLYRIWDTTLPVRMLTVIGLNPSTADEKEDDPTIRRCIGFAKAWGCGGLYMLNLFAFRATDPKVMFAEPRPVGKRNDGFIVHHCASGNVVLAAWGVDGDHRNRDNKVLGLLKSNGLLDKVVCLGETKGGFPRHPLYVKGDMQPQPYRGRC